MHRFVEDELSRAPDLVERTVAAAVLQLQQPSKSPAAGPSDRKVQQDLIDTLRRGSKVFERAFVDQLQSLVQADVQGLEPLAGAGASTLAGDLQLMDETRVEADIEISRAAQLIDSAAEWELRELQTFTSTLMGHTHVSADANPLRPVAYAHALWDACAALCPSTAQRSLLLHVTASAMASQLKLAWAAACTRLESQGVTPGIYRTMVVTGVPAAAPPPSTPKAFEQALQQISTALHQRSAQSQPHAPASPALPASTAFGEFGLVRSSQQAVAPEGLDPHVVELLSRIFEAVLSDSQLPVSLRPVMARLQTSVLRLCLVDRSLLDTPQHPVWLLMNRIAQAAQLWPQPNDPRAARLQACCESLVSDIVSVPQPSAAIFVQGQAQLEEQLGRELKEQQDGAGKSIATLTALEQRVLLEQTISQQLTEQAQRVHTTPRLREFLTRDWARVIVESTQRYGSDDERTASALKTVDDLLWSLNVPDHPQSRQRLLGLLPDLLKRVRAGMTLAALPEAQQQTVLDELMVVHTASLRPGERPHMREATPQEIFQRLRDEQAPAATSSTAGAFADSLIEIASMDTVPAELIDEVDPSGHSAERQLDAMTPGATCRWFLSGKWRCVQLLWRSDSLNYLVFAGETAGRTHSITRQALLRLMGKSLVKPLSETQLIQRAVHRVMRDLAVSH